MDLAPDRGAAPLRPRGCGTGDADRPDPCPRQRWALDRLGRPGRRDADLCRWRRHCPGPRTVPATGAAPLRQRLRDGGELRRPARQLGSPRDQHRSHLRRLDPRRRGAEGLAEAADRQPRGLGCRSRLRRLPAAGAASVRDGPSRRHPPHGQRQRLHARGGAVDRPRHLPLPRLRQRLERHRLQRARRPLRDALRGPCRRPQAAGRRSAGSGLQLPDHLDRLDRRPHQRGAHAAGATIDHPVPRLEDGGEPPDAGHRHRAAHVGGRPGEPLSRPGP